VTATRVATLRGTRNGHFRGRTVGNVRSLLKWRRGRPPNHDPALSFGIAFRLPKVAIHGHFLPHASCNVARRSSQSRLEAWVTAWVGGKRHGEAHRTAERAGGVTGQAGRHVCRWRRALSPGHQPRGPLLGLPLRTGRQGALHGSRLPQRCGPVRSPRAGHRSAPANFGRGWTPSAPARPRRPRNGPRRPSR
jgi:hypothetical protein